MTGFSASSWRKARPFAAPSATFILVDQGRGREPDACNIIITREGEINCLLEYFHLVTKKTLSTYSVIIRCSKEFFTPLSKGIWSNIIASTRVLARLRARFDSIDTMHKKYIEYYFLMFTGWTLEYKSLVTQHSIPGISWRKNTDTQKSKYMPQNSIMCECSLWLKIAYIKSSYVFHTHDLICNNFFS